MCWLFSWIQVKSERFLGNAFGKPNDQQRAQYELPNLAAAESELAPVRKKLGQVLAQAD
jgi:hypothetical protein